MALQFTGNDVALVRNATNGKFDWQVSSSGPNKGNFVLDNTRTHAVLTTLVSWKRGTRPGRNSQTPEGGYYWDTSGRRGTLIWTISQDKIATPSQLKAYAEDGGQQLLDLKYIASFTASATRRAPGKLSVTATWTLPSGNQPPSVTL